MTVKASDVSRNLTLGRLEKQFGPFQEVHHLAQVIYDDKSEGRKIPPPLDDANRDNENWNAYISAKTEHSGDKKERSERLYMTQQGEREKLRGRQKLERQALAVMFGKGVSRRELNQQRSILATKQAYERAVLKEKQKEQRKTLKTQTAAFMSYEQWLRNRNLAEEAEKWRHRKNKRILLLERPDCASDTESREYIGLSGFSMTVTRQGVKFAHQDCPETTAFVDVGRVIKVHEQSDVSLLAALQLAQSKWGGVKVNGTDEYKRKCAELAVKNGIRVTNPELQELLRKPEETKPPENSMSRYAMARELGKKMLGEPIFVVTDAFEEREYSGLLLGVIEKEGRHYAAQCFSDGHVILHSADKDYVNALKSLTGKNVDIFSKDGLIKNLIDYESISRRLEKSRGWSR